MTLLVGRRHLAARLRSGPAVHDRQDGGTSRTCCSPKQNLLRAYAPGAIGCDCAGTEAAVCAVNDEGRGVGLVCGTSHRWEAVEDGPCGPQIR